MITEDYVNFETAKLLKEKGFDGECRDYYNTEGHFYSEDFKSNWNQDAVGAITLISAPTLQMAMKWLREVHNLHIMVDCIGAKNYMPTIQFTRDSRDVVVKSEIIKFGGNGFDSHEQAVDAAIKYCLENLI